MEQYTVTVIGLGFVGLTTALGLAEAGHRVYGVEKEPARLAQIQAGQLPFAEPNLDKALVRHLANGKFQATNNALTAATASQIIFLCVGTPCGDDGAADLSGRGQAFLLPFAVGNHRHLRVRLGCAEKAHFGISPFLVCPQHGSHAFRALPCCFR